MGAVQGLFTATGLYKRCAFLILVIPTHVSPCRRFQDVLYLRTILEPLAARLRCKPLQRLVIRAFRGCLGLLKGVFFIIRVFYKAVFDGYVKNV